MITISKKLRGSFDAVKFIAKATNPKLDNPKWGHIYSDGAWLYGTDTKQLHSINADYYALSGFDRGFYAIIKNNQSEIILHKVESEDWVFPDAEKIMPKNAMILVQGNYTGASICMSRIAQDFYVRLSENRFKGIGMNFELLENALLIGENFQILATPPTDESYYSMSPMMAKGLYNNFYSLIMPFQRSEAEYEVS